MAKISGELARYRVASVISRVRTSPGRCTVRRRPSSRNEPFVALYRDRNATSRDRASSAEIIATWPYAPAGGMARKTTHERYLGHRRSSQSEELTHGELTVTCIVHLSITSRFWVPWYGIKVSFCGSGTLKNRTSMVGVDAGWLVEVMKTAQAQQIQVFNVQECHRF